MKKSLTLLALIVFSVLFFAACGPKGAASNSNALTATYGNGMVSGGNVAPVATAGNAG
jgi:hypothetical protein